MKTVFPKEFLENTSELYRYNCLKKSQLIYIIVLVFLVCIAIALPLIKIDLYASSPGMIRPSKERNLITSPINGKVNNVLIDENISVQRGDTLVTLDDSSVSLELNLAQEQLDSLQLYIKDLKTLCHTKGISSDSLATFLFKSQLAQYKQKLKDLNDHFQRNYSQFERSNHLYNKGVIAKIELENATFELDKSRNNLLYFKKHQQSKWLNQLYQKQADLSKIQSKLQLLHQRKGLHYILSPSSGSIQNLKGLERHSFVYRGGAIAEISPQTDLMVECYVSSSDIGFLKNSHPVKFLIDAFDHNHWGSATGKIVRINQDVSTNNNMFKVLCSVNETSLFLNKTTKGTLQKGMTLKALFLIDNRSLFQLLFDKIEDWFDPN